MPSKTIPVNLKILLFLLVIASHGGCRQDPQEDSSDKDFDLSPIIGEVENNQQKTPFPNHQEADEELNRVYKRILSDYQQDPIFISNLRTSQQFWIKFRDAELEMKYPKREQGYYGSSHSQCRSQYLGKLTQDRINTLNIWVEGIEEGDVCAGSVKTK